MLLWYLDDEELERLKKDVIDSGKLKLRKHNMQNEVVRGSPGMGRTERGHGMVMDNKPEFLHSMPANRDDFVMVNDPVEKFSKSCIVQQETPPEFALIDRHNIISVAG